jgi:hypothetical protein
MDNGIKFYKIKLIKQLLEQHHGQRCILYNELVTNATDPDIWKRRLRMMCNLNSYESQLLQKINDFETDDVKDLIDFQIHHLHKDLLNRSA